MHSARQSVAHDSRVCIVREAVGLRVSRSTRSRAAVVNALCQLDRRPLTAEVPRDEIALSLSMTALSCHAGIKNGDRRQHPDDRRPGYAGRGAGTRTAALYEPPAGTKVLCDYAVGPAKECSTSTPSLSAPLCGVALSAALTRWARACVPPTPQYVRL